MKVSEPARYDEAKKLVGDLNPTMTSSVLSVGAKQYDMAEPGNGVLTLHMTDAYKTQTQQQILDQSIEVVRRRIDELGTREPTIERQGEDRILVQVPGLQDPDQLKTILGKTAKMTLPAGGRGRRSVGAHRAHRRRYPAADERQSQSASAARSWCSAGSWCRATGSPTPAQSFDSRTGQPVVTFRFDSVGAREFGDVTKENVGHRFAIVLDKQVISAPVIQEPILGGSGQITGNFTTQTANNLAILLRAGALAGAAQDYRGTHGGRRAGRGFRQGRPLFGDCGPGDGRGCS